MTYRCATDDPNECATVRERRSAARSDAIERCDIHGPHPEHARMIAAERAALAALGLGIDADGALYVLHADAAR